MSHSLKEQYASSPLFGGNAAAVEGLYEKYLDDPASVAGAWRDYFDTLGDADTEIAHSEIRAELLAALAHVLAQLVAVRHLAALQLLAVDHRAIDGGQGHRGVARISWAVGMFR